MLVSNRFKIFKSYTLYLYSKFPEFNNINIKRIFLHFYKSDFLIIFVSEIFFFIINLFSLIIYRKKFYKINETKNKFLINFVSFFLQPLKKRVDELFLTILNIQDNSFKERTQFEKSDTSINSSYKFIVVGSGPSGSISSYYLNKSFGSTLLIEKGGNFATYESKHPGDEFLYKWKYGGVNTSLFNTQIVFSSGECLGGGSEINSGLLHEPDENFVKKWIKDYNVKNISYEKLLESLSKVSKICNFSNIDSKNLSSADFFKKGSKLNNFKIEKLNSFQVLSGDKVIKNSMKNTIIKKYLQENGNLLTNFNVKKIHYSNGLWFVDGIKNNKKITFTCEYLFLCCGSIETSKLLISSKIKTVKKPINFFLHPMIKLIVEFNKEVQLGKENVHSYQVTEFFPDYILGEAASGLRFLKMSSLFNLDMQDKINLNWKKMSIYHATFSMGKGRLYKLPFINKYLKLYFIKNSEKEKMISSYINLCKLLFDGGAKNIYLLGKKIENVNNHDYEKIIRSSFKRINDFKFSSVHILGGVTSGENKESIVDSNGKIKGQKNIFVNDSSLINNKLLKNPQGLIMSIAKYNIDNFIKKFNE